MRSVYVIYILCFFFISTYTYAAWLFAIVSWVSSKCACVCFCHTIAPINSGQYILPCVIIHYYYFRLQIATVYKASAHKHSSSNHLQHCATSVRYHIKTITHPHKHTKSKNPLLNVSNTQSTSTHFSHFSSYMFPISLPTVSHIFRSIRSQPHKKLILSYCIIIFMVKRRNIYDHFLRYMIDVAHCSHHLQNNSLFLILIFQSKRFLKCTS